MKQFVGCQLFAVKGFMKNQTAYAHVVKRVMISSRPNGAGNDDLIDSCVSGDVTAGA